MPIFGFWMQWPMLLVWGFSNSTIPSSFLPAKIMLLAWEHILLFTCPSSDLTRWTSFFLFTHTQWNLCELSELPQQQHGSQWNHPFGSARSPLSISSSAQSFPMPGCTGGCFHSSHDTCKCSVNKVTSYPLAMTSRLKCCMLVKNPKGLCLSNFVLPGMTPDGTTFGWNTNEMLSSASQSRRSKGEKFHISLG